MSTFGIVLCVFIGGAYVGDFCYRVREAYKGGTFNRYRGL